MTTEVDICNRALANVKEQSITSLDEESNEADICRLYYVLNRQHCLTASNWHFNQKVVPLFLSGRDDTLGWKYIYNFPSSGALKIVRLVPKKGEPILPIDYIIRNRAGVPRVLTNEKDVQAECLIDILDFNHFPIQFISLLSWRLTALIATPLLGTDKGRYVADDAMKAYEYELNNNIIRSSQERHVTKDRTSGIVKSRWKRRWN